MSNNNEVRSRVARSLRAGLLRWLLIPLVIFMVADGVGNYRAALRTTERAYDRMLITLAHSLGDQIRLERGKLVVTLPHPTLELYAGAIEQGSSNGLNHGRMSYRVAFLNGTTLAGDDELPPYMKRPVSHPVYKSMVEIYDVNLGDEPWRIAALLQPVESFDGEHLVAVQVGESAAYRIAIARQTLRDTIIRQGLLMLVLLGLVWAVVTVALLPVRELAREFNKRNARDFKPVQRLGGAKELQPLVIGFNDLLARLSVAYDQQRRFIADASHQLRTPLSVLKLQVDAGLRGDIPPAEALAAIAATSNRATRLAEQLLSLARAHQDIHQEPQTRIELRTLASDVIVYLSPLIARKRLDFHFDAEPCELDGYDWMLREVISNLLRNAIEFTPLESALGLRITNGGKTAHLIVWDSGPGLSDAMTEDLFKPFTSGSASGGAGLGLAICHDLAAAMGASITIHNRCEDGAIKGLEAILEINSKPAPSPPAPAAISAAYSQQT